MKYTALQFTGPRSVESVEKELQNPGPDEVLVQTQCSAISSGTEMLAYRGQLPDDLVLDESLPGMQDKITYPFSYGYAVTGIVVEVGRNVDKKWNGAHVFAFQPHASHFVSGVTDLILLPASLHPEDAIFLANMETAVSFLMDGQPIIGEHILIVGLGIVGLLTATLVKRNADLRVYGVDTIERRRAWGHAINLDAVYSPTEMALQLEKGLERFDLVFELSGNPAGLNVAIDATRKTGRIILGSWYGKKPAHIDLGGRFHRSKIRVHASQVSSIDPVHAGRWTKKRRLDVALGLLASIKPSRFITHMYNIEHAKEAYKVVDEHPEKALQVVLTYT